jgi:hypothetical protein
MILAGASYGALIVAFLVGIIAVNRSQPVIAGDEG